MHDTNLIDREENIPVLNFHGDADKIVPCDYNYPFTELDTSLTSNIVSKMYGSQCIHERLTNQGIHSELVMFPGIAGPAELTVNSALPAYSVPGQKDVSYYWTVSGGKIIPGTAKNQAGIKLDLPVALPEKTANYYPASKK